MTQKETGLTAQQRAWLGSMFDLLAAHLGTDTELVLRDPATGEMLDLRNGHVSGGAGRAEPGGDNPFGQLFFAGDGRILRSSSLLLPDESGSPAAEVSINEDITGSVAMENYLRRRNQSVPRPVGQDVNGILEELLEEAQLRAGKSAAAMNRAEKKETVRFLDERGAFLIAKSGPRVCGLLGISKFTLYNYLDSMRGGKKE